MPNTKNPIAVVTGAYGGLGSELCKHLAKAGARLVLVDRNLEKSRAFGGELERAHPGSFVEAFSVDLASHTDVRRLTGAMVARYPKIDFLFNNAGVLTETMQFSGHGNELHFEVNTLAPLLLVDGLRPALAAAAGAVVVSTSAGLSLRAKTLDWDDLVKPKTFEKLYGPYVASKEALNVVSSALARELAGDGILVRTADPGPNNTRLTRGKGTPLWMRLFYWALPSPAKGARKIFDVGFSAQWGSQTGIFVSGGKAVALPPALRDATTQDALLRKCRAQAAVDHPRPHGA